MTGAGLGSSDGPFPGLSAGAHNPDVQPGGGPTTVVHVNHPDGWDVYVGRAEGRAKNPAARVQSPWANRHRVRDHGRTGALERFDHELTSAVERDASGLFVKRLRLLKGARLACWCAGVDEILTAADPVVCHGQLLAKYADRLEP